MNIEHFALNGKIFNNGWAEESKMIRLHQRVIVLIRSLLNFRFMKIGKGTKAQLKDDY
jgi:hypothetical protein